MFAVTCIPVSRTPLFGWLWQPCVPGMAGCPVLWDHPATRLSSPLSLLAGHNGLVAVSTESGVVLPPSLGDSGAPGRVHGQGRVVVAGPMGLWGAEPSLVGGGADTICKRVLEMTRACPTRRDGQQDATLPQAAYLQRAGLRTAVLEKRHVLGGAAVTEEIVPGTPVHPVSPCPWPALSTGTPHCPTSSRLQVLPGILPAQPAAAADLHRAGAAGTGTHPSPGCRHLLARWQGELAARPSLQGGPCHLHLAAAWSEGAPAGPLLLHPTAGGQEPPSLPPAGA